MTYTIRNLQSKTARQLVLTAAAVNRLGELRGLEMPPVKQQLSQGSVEDYKVAFETLDLQSDEYLVVGIQGRPVGSSRRMARRAPARAPGGSPGAHVALSSQSL